MISNNHQNGFCFNWSCSGEMASSGSFTILEIFTSVPKDSTASTARAGGADGKSFSFIFGEENGFAPSLDEDDGKAGSSLGSDWFEDEDPVLMTSLVGSSGCSCVCLIAGLAVLFELDKGGVTGNPTPVKTELGMRARLRASLSKLMPHCESTT